MPRRRGDGRRKDPLTEFVQRSAREFLDLRKRVDALEKAHESCRCPEKRRRPIRLGPVESTDAQGGGIEVQEEPDDEIVNGGR